MTNNEIMVFGEITSDGDFAPVVFELLSAAVELRKKLNNSKISVLAPYFFNNNYEKYINELKCAGCDRLIVIDDEKLRDYSTAFYAKSVISIINKYVPVIVLVGATSLGRDLAPVVSTSLGTGLTADCTKLDIIDENKLAATRPTFGGSLMATILCKNYPQMATVRPNVLQRKNTDYYKDIEFIKEEINFSDLNNFVKILDIKKLSKNSNTNLSEAKIVVAGGRGMKTKEGFALITKLAELIGASAAASRGAVDLKIAPQSIQIGQTGKTVTPKIYIACGISGAIQHTVGMSSSDVIIAINNNPKAKIFEISDYAIIGDVFEILPNWIRALEN